MKTFLFFATLAFGISYGDSCCGQDRLVFDSAGQVIGRFHQGAGELRLYAPNGRLEVRYPIRGQEKIPTGRISKEMGTRGSVKRVPKRYNIGKLEEQIIMGDVLQKTPKHRKRTHERDVKKIDTQTAMPFGVDGFHGKKRKH